jgi:oligoendopeptidase F
MDKTYRKETYESLYNSYVLTKKGISDGEKHVDFLINSAETAMLRDDTEVRKEVIKEIFNMIRYHRSLLAEMVEENTERKRILKKLKNVF